MKPMFSYATVGVGVAAFDYPIDNAANTPTSHDFVVSVNGKLQKAQPASTAILGLMDGKVYLGQGIPAETGMVRIDPNNVYVMEYTGVTKTSLTDADKGTAFDIDADMKLNLDATTVGQLRVVNFDNATKRVWVQVAKQQLA